LPTLFNNHLTALNEVKRIGRFTLFDHQRTTWHVAWLQPGSNCYTFKREQLTQHGNTGQRCIDHAAPIHLTEGCGEQR
jgi:hypothetical protein